MGGKVNIFSRKKICWQCYGQHVSFMASKVLAHFGSKRKVFQEPADENNGAKKPRPSEYEFNIAKLQKYEKQFQFWNTLNKTACDDSSKHVSWLKIDASRKMYCCWVCQQYKTIANSENEVTKGTFYFFLLLISLILN